MASLKICITLLCKKVSTQMDMRRFCWETLYRFCFDNLIIALFSASLSNDVQLHYISDVLEIYECTLFLCNGNVFQSFSDTQLCISLFAEIELWIWTHQQAGLLEIGGLQIWGQLQPNSQIWAPTLPYKSLSSTFQLSTSPCTPTNLSFASLFLSHTFILSISCN